MMKKNRGFTLVELLIAMMISSIALMAVYMIFTSQNKATASQRRIAEIQQNLRASMFVLSQEVRKIGYNPDKIKGSAAPGISTAKPGNVTFQVDLNENGAGFNGIIGNNNEIYSASNDPGEIRWLQIDQDTDFDGVADSFPGQLCRKYTDSTGATTSDVIADNIDAVNFVYLDAGGSETAILADIRAIEVTIVARASLECPGFVNQAEYKNLQGDVIFSVKTQGENTLPGGGDGYKRRVLSQTITCMNLGS